RVPPAPSTPVAPRVRLDPACARGRPAPPRRRPPDPEDIRPCPVWSAMHSPIGSGKSRSGGVPLTADESALEGLWSQKRLIQHTCSRDNVWRSSTMMVRATTPATLTREYVSTLPYIEDNWRCERRAPSSRGMSRRRECLRQRAQ